MHVRFTDDDIQSKAVELGLVEAGEPVARSHRSRVLAALIQQAASQDRPPVEPQLAKEVVVQPDGVILVDGEVFPWLVAREPMDIRVSPDDVSTVRLTLMTKAVQILKSEPQAESE